MKKLIFALPLLLVITLAFFLWPEEPVADTAVPETIREVAAETKQQAAAQNTGPAEKRTLAKFKPNEFRDFYNGLALPNTTPIAEPPAITGDTPADSYIQSLAEKRGYELRSVPSGRLTTYKGVELQPLLVEDWKGLSTAAKKAGHTIGIRSGYRSVEDQRGLFLNALNSRGIEPANLAAGLSNGVLDRVMDVTAPPGYSRHHSGYTVDVYDSSVAIFEFSPAYAWLKRNNFENAKKFGFLPSYPEGADGQGPEPEAWEFVWAGRDYVLE